MTPGRKCTTVVALAAFAGALAGCVTVNPEADYRRSAELIQRATGVAGVYDAREAEAVEKFVDTRLRDGLTAHEAAEIALLNNPDLQAAFKDIGIARADLVQSGLLANPTLAMAFRLPAGGGLTAIDLDIGQNIADLWQISARKRAGERNLEQTILRIAHQASELAGEAKEAYYTALGAQQREAIARENLDVTRTTLELTEFRQEAGAGNALDVNLARGAVLEAQLAVDRARLAASEAKRELVALLGLTIDAVQLTLAKGSPPPIRSLPREDLAAVALANRLDVRSLREAVRAADERLVAEYRRVFPSLEIGLSMEREARGPIQGRDVLADTARASIVAGRLTAPEIQPRSARDVDQDITLGPGFALELPIFDQNQAQIARARYLLEQAVHRLDALETTIVREVHSAADQSETARKIVKFYDQDVLPQSRQNLDMARESYRAGKTGFLSMLDAERTLLATRGRYTTAQEQAAVMVARLERVVGLPISELAATAVRESSVPASTQPTADQASHGERSRIQEQER